LAKDNEAAATSQTWQWCCKSKVAKREGGKGAECFISCSQVAHLQGLNFISRNQYEITKSTATKDFCTSGRDFHPLGAKIPSRCAKNFNYLVICSITFVL
jgi:hypothetical protein